MNNPWFSLAGLSSAHRWPLCYPYWPRDVRKTPDIPLSEEAKSRLAEEKKVKIQAKKLRQAKNKERGKKK